MKDILSLTKDILSLTKDILSHISYKNTKNISQIIINIFFKSIIFVFLQN